MNYFYEQEAELFTFYRIPKELFTHPKYKDTSDSAKILYGLLLDRNSVSRKNGWIDTHRRVYIQYAREEAMEKLGCSHNKISRLFKELCDVELIEEVRQDLGKANIIYVGKFQTSNAQIQTSQNVKSDEGKKNPLNAQNRSSRTHKTGVQEHTKREFKNTQNQPSGHMGESKENPRLEGSEFASSNTDLSYINKSYNNNELYSQSVCPTTVEYIKALCQTTDGQANVIPETIPEKEIHQSAHPATVQVTPALCQTTDKQTKAIPEQEGSYSVCHVKSGQDLCQPKPSRLVHTPSPSEAELKELERVYQNGQIHLYEARLFIEHVIKKLYTDGNMPYILKMGLTHTDIKDRLRVLTHEHIDAAQQKMVNCQTNKELYFAKCLLTAIVELPLHELMLDMQESSMPLLERKTMSSPQKIPQRDQFDQRPELTDEELEKYYANLN